VGPLPHATTPPRGRGYQELRPPVYQKRSGRPELDVRTSRLCMASPLEAAFRPS
jgi:hypothetical protein